jgi:hypothetical protein
MAVRATVTALAAAALIAVPALPAVAADEVSLSSDGVNWGSTLSAPVFGTVATMVPGEIRTATMWVRNSSPLQVRLLLTLESATWTDSDYAAALSAGATAPAAVGSTLNVMSAGACRQLLTGATLDPGESIPVTMTIALGNLDGNVGQNSTVSMGLGVTIIEMVGSVATGECSTATPPSVIVPLTPAGVAASTAAPEEAGDGEPTPSPSSTPLDPIPFILSNTAASFNEQPLLWAVLAAIIGGAAFYLFEFLPWRRRRHEDDDHIESPLTVTREGSQP